MTSTHCAVTGCEAPTRSLGLCKSHYDRQRKYGDATYVPQPQHRGLTSTGYVRIFNPDHPMAMADGWCFEHRVVAYDNGLLSGKNDRRHVHHRDHDKQNNAIDNLRVVEAEKHMKEHHRSTSRTEVVDLYQSGMTTIQIAQTLGTFPGNISRILREEGAAIRPPQRMIIPEKEILELYERGLSVDKISQRINIGSWAIRRFLQESGIPSRPVGRPPRR